MSTKRAGAAAIIMLLPTVLAPGCGKDSLQQPDTAPTASFTLSPAWGTMETVFLFDASSSSDEEDETPSLQVRWDWEDDGTWDTGWSATKTASHQYDMAGTATIRLEVKDTGGLTDEARQGVIVDALVAVPEMVLVPAGTFTMGDGEALCGKDQHQVTLTHSFYLGKYEVTKKEYRDALQWAYDHGYVGANAAWVRDNLDGSTNRLVDSLTRCRISYSLGKFTVEPGTEDCPVIMVTWYGAAAYCDWLSMQQGLPRAYDHSTWECNRGDPYGATGYRLPTDAEWEYAAQYDDGRTFPWGNEPPTCKRANCWADSSCFGEEAPVGSCPDGISKLGFYDMAGNVMEWCNDWWTCDLGTVSQTDPAGPGRGPDSYRVMRGGAWYFSGEHLRCSGRLYGYTESAGKFDGFRLARTQVQATVR